jgi:membrane-bound metal-dependent hydrolase YbcI (DUF457 family)
MGTTHLTIGVLLVFLLEEYTMLLQGNEVYAAALLLVATVLPDIDSGTSLLGRKLGVLKKVLNHRGFFHSIMALVSFGIVVYLVTNSRPLSYVFMIGYGSHLVADSVTKEGTRLFYPSGLVTKGWLRVGSAVETLLFVVMVVLTVQLVV